MSTPVPSLPEKGVGDHPLAFVDESESHRQLDPETYILAAATCRPEHVDEVRATVSDLRLKGQVKLHWRDETARRQRDIVKTIADLPLENIVVVRDGRAGEKPERRRRLCLQTMLYELDQSEVRSVTFESRGPADDKRDFTMLGHLRAQHQVRGQLRIDHVRGPRDAMLWIPDAICGATSANRIGNPEYLEALQASYPIRTITLRE